MKKILFLLSVLLVSCQDTTILETTTPYSFEGIDISVYTIDSCEYIGHLKGNARILTHKGNCRFCKIRNENKLKVE
jgi:hypothetical protein